MIVVLGGMLAAGILLALAPWVWHDGRRSTRAQTDGRLRRALDAAGLAETPTAYLGVATVGAATVGAAAMWLLTGLSLVALLGAVAGAWAPAALLRVRVRRMQRVRRALWPDVCELLVASVRAGMSLPAAVSSLATTAPVPLRPAFARFASDLAASGHFDSAALRLKGALGDPVGDRIVETLRMARQVGGTELSPVLRSLAASVRADATLRGEVEARQSWVRGAAALGVVAPWFVLALLATRPEGAQAYASPEGSALIIGGAIVTVIAHRLMMHLGRLPEPQRWFR